jgi:single-stranded DNA-binding protein
MAQIHVIGWITNDLEMKYSESESPYIRFGLAERIGYGNQMRMQYYQVWAWKETAETLFRSGLKKGSLVRLSGTLMLEEYIRQDGITRDKRLRISLSSGGFTPVSKGGSNAPKSHSTVEIVDGGKDPLPA